MIVEILHNQKFLKLNLQVGFHPIILKVRISDNKKGFCSTKNDGGKIVGYLLFCDEKNTATGKTESCRKKKEEKKKKSRKCFKKLREV